MRNVLKVTTIYEIPCDEKDLDALANATITVKAVDEFIRQKAGKGAVLETAWRIDRKREWQDGKPSPEPEGTDKQK